MSRRKVITPRQMAQMASEVLDAVGPIAVPQATPAWTHSKAVFSEDGAYRYRLERLAGRVAHLPAVTFIMLNPSTADQDNDDATMRRCWQFAQRWRFQRLVVVNLFGLRSSDPRRLPNHPDPSGPFNLAFVSAAIESARRDGSMVVCAWGQVPKTLQCHAETVKSLLFEKGGDIRYLRLNTRGQPWHPLYLPASLEPQPWLEMQGPMI